MHLIWDWELDSEFEGNPLSFTQYSPRSLNWVDWLGNPVGVSTGVTEKSTKLFVGKNLETRSFYVLETLAVFVLEKI